MKKALLIGAVGLAASLALAGNAKAATPDAINDLRCDTGSELGSLWLTWTVPANTDNGYEMKYVEGNTLAYDSATSYSQSWLSGTVGSVRQELVRGLSPNIQYAIGMKAKNTDASSSSVSNNILCMPAGVGRSSADTLPPSTLITTPAANSSIQNNVPLIIEGVSRDNGSSSVQKVELSFDNGYGWSEAKIVSNDSGNYSWEYEWKNPSDGPVNILVRSYDWLNNIETPISLPLTLSSGAVSTTPPAPVTSTTPSSTVTAREAAITLVQQQLIVLIQKLIALLLAGGR